MSKPLDALFKAMCRAVLVPRYHRLGRSGAPGKVVEECPEDIRAELRRLRSRDVQNVRPDAILEPSEEPPCPNHRSSQP